MVNKVVVKKTLDRLNLKNLRQLAQENNINIDSNVTRAEIISVLLNPPWIETGTRNITGGGRIKSLDFDWPNINQFDSFLQQYGDLPPTELDKALTESEVTFETNYSPDEWYQILSNPDVVANKTSQFVGLPKYLASRDLFRKDITLDVLFKNWESKDRASFLINTVIEASPKLKEKLEQLRKKGNLMFDEILKNTVGVIKVESIVNSISWSPSGQILVSGSRDGNIRFWNPMTGVLIKKITGHSASIHTVTWKPDGQRLASGSYDNTIKIWDSDGSLISNLQDTNPSPRSRYFDNRTMAWSPDGQKITSGSVNGKIKIWNPTNGQLIITLDTPLGPDDRKTNVLSVAWSPDSNLLASSTNTRLRHDYSWDSYIFIHDTRTGNLIKKIQAEDGELITSLAWSPAGDLASGGDDYGDDRHSDYKVKIWNVQRNKYTKRLQQSIPISSVAWSPNGERLAVGETRGNDYLGSNRYVKIWDLYDDDDDHDDDGSRSYIEPWGEPEDDSSWKRQATNNDIGVSSVAWSPNGDRLAAGGRVGTLEQPDVTDGQIKIWYI